MIGKDFFNLSNKLLIATPYTMAGNVFHESLIYVVNHSPEGSVGFIVNRLVSNNAVNELFKKNSQDCSVKFLNNELHIGGPVEVERGFFLHSAEYDKNLLYKIEGSDIAISSNNEILQDINNGQGPKSYIFLIGYTAWSKSEMEYEIKNNLWIVSEPDTKLIFSQDSKNNKWLSAISNLGMDTADFAPSFIANC